MGYNGIGSEHLGPFPNWQHAGFPQGDLEAFRLLRSTNVLDFPATRLRINIGFSPNCLFNLVRRPHTYPFFPDYVPRVRGHGGYFGI